MIQKESPSEKRESALNNMLRRLGATETADERYNNGFAHHSLAVHSSFARAHEERLASFVNSVNVTIKEAIAIPDKNKEKYQKNCENAEELLGKTILIERSIFKNTMTITRWIENFYQESPSINARARDDQVEVGSKGFAVPVITPFSSSMEEEE